MSVLHDLDLHAPRLDIELSAGCDHRCGHCYNVWNAEPGDPQHGYAPKGQLSTPDLLALITKALTQSGAEHVTVTGGEPLLRPDALDILRRCCALAERVQLITNGSHVPPDTAAALAEMGVASVQLTLLAGHRALHDELKGAACFDDTLRAALNLRDAGVPAQVCFVAMKANHGQLAAVMELCVALGVKALSYNRMSPTGGAVHELEALMPDAAMIEADLEVADRLGRRWGIRVGTAMPVMPCLIRLERYPWVDFGFCSTGTASPNLVMDPQGRLRSCNLSAGVLGDLRVDDWADILGRTTAMDDFRRNVPEVCRGCAYERSCQGGCKESGFAVFGDHAAPEPLLAGALPGG